MTNGMPFSVGKGILVAVFFLFSWAVETSLAADAAILQDPGRLFDFKVPEGFASETVDEPGIVKWRKDNAEIYIVVGELFTESAEKLFQDLKTAAEKNKGIQEVKVIRLKGARSLLYKEKAPEDGSRLRLWRMLVITDKKVITLDVTAPSKEFDAFVPAFESAIKSFKLKSPS